MAEHDLGMMNANGVKERERASNLRDYVGVLFRHRKVFTHVFVWTLLGVLIFTFGVMNYRYQTTMKVYVIHQRANPLVTPGSTRESTQTENPATDVTQGEVNSEMSLLNNDDLLTQVVTTLKLQDGKSWRDTLLFFIHYTPEERIARAERNLAKQITVQQEASTNIIDVVYVAYWDKQAGADIVNTLGKIYLQRHLDLRTPPGALPFFMDETEKYRKGMMDAEAQLASFDRQHNAVSAAMERDAVVQKLSDFHAALGETRANIAQTTNRIKDLESQLATTPSRMDTVQQTTDASQLLEQAKSTLLGLQLKRAELLTKYDPSYPLVQQVDEQIGETRKSIDDAQHSPTQSISTDKDPTHELIREELAKAKADLATIEGREAGLVKVIGQIQAQAIDLDQKAMNQKDLLRESSADEQNYLLYLHKREDARIENALNSMKIANVAIAQPGLRQELPYYSPILVGVLGLILTLMVSIGAAFAAEFLRPSFETPDEVNEFLEIPVFASIPVNGN